jgi:hypothetical protein
VPSLLKRGNVDLLRLPVGRRNPAAESDQDDGDAHDPTYFQVARSNRTVRSL